MNVPIDLTGWHWDERAQLSKSLGEADIRPEGCFVRYSNVDSWTPEPYLVEASEAARLGLTGAMVKPVLRTELESVLRRGRAIQESGQIYAFRVSFGAPALGRTFCARILSTRVWPSLAAGRIFHRATREEAVVDVVFEPQSADTTVRKAVSVNGRLIQVLSTDHFGELKDSLIMWHTISSAPRRDGDWLLLHASAAANVWSDRTLLFLGSSDSGKTTLALSPPSGWRPAADDMVDWSHEGLSSVDRGVYLSAESFLERWATDASRSGPPTRPPRLRPALIQHLGSDHGPSSGHGRSSSVKDASAATRVKDVLGRGVGVYSRPLGQPSDLFILVRDWAGVLPAVSAIPGRLALRLYAGGLTSVDATTFHVDPCFGAKYTVRPIYDQVQVFRRLLDVAQPRIWLLNTGRAGDPSRLVGVDLSRALIDHVTRNSPSPTHTDDRLGLGLLAHPDGVDSSLMQVSNRVSGLGNVNGVFPRLAAFFNCLLE